MWKLIEVELKYNRVPIIIAFGLIVALMAVIFIAGEDNWYGPSGLYGLLIIFNLGTINIISKKEKRVFSIPYLPLKRGTVAAARAVYYAVMVLIGNLIPLMMAYFISPGILTPVTLGRFFIVAGSILAINGSYLIVCDAGSTFDDSKKMIKYFGVVVLLILANSIFYTFLVIEMPMRYSGILYLLGLGDYKDEILSFLYSFEAGAILISLGLAFFAVSYYTFQARRKFTA